MAEKGGKGFSVSKGKTVERSVRKKKGLLKGKDGTPSSTRSLQIESDSDSEGFIEDDNRSSFKLNGKTSPKTNSAKKKVTFEDKSWEKVSSDTPVSKANWGKGQYSVSGKGGGKGGLAQKPPANVSTREVELKLDIELPKNAKILMDCEAADILQDIQERLTVLLEDPNIKIPESFDKALQYSKINSHYNDVKSARQVLNSLKRIGVTDGEICMIGNSAPDSIDEVYALVPSLKANKHKNEQPIKEVLTKLAALRAS